MRISIHDVIHLFFERKLEELGSHRLLAEKLGIGRTAVNLLVNRKGNREFGVRHLEAFAKHEGWNASMLLLRLADIAWELERGRPMSLEIAERTQSIVDKIDDVEKRFAGEARLPQQTRRPSPRQKPKKKPSLLASVTAADSPGDGHANRVRPYGGRQRNH